MTDVEKMDHRYRPAYGCYGCRDDYSWPAEDLAVLSNGDLVCQNCYDECDEPPGSYWSDLPAFVPLPTSSPVERPDFSDCAAAWNRVKTVPRATWEGFWRGWDAAILAAEKVEKGGSDDRG